MTPQPQPQSPVQPSSATGLQGGLSLGLSVALRYDVIVVFVDDLVTGVAALFQKVNPFRPFPFTGNTSLYKKTLIIPRKQDKAVELMVARIEQLLGTEGQLRSLTIAGHGYPGGWGHRLDLSELQDLEHPRRKALERLRGRFHTQNEGITMLMCDCAKNGTEWGWHDGREFLKLVASLVGVPVRGWDNKYEIRPTGDEWTAQPDGTILLTGSTGRISLGDFSKEHIQNMAMWPTIGALWLARLLGMR
jgi:hypothetical protein